LTVRLGHFVNSLIEAPRLFELLHLVLKDGQNGNRRVAAVQSDGQLMRKKVLLRFFLIRFQSSDESEIGKGSGCGVSQHRTSDDERMVGGLEKKTIRLNVLCLVNENCLQRQGATATIKKLGAALLFDYQR
jgi:hypothetical protein